MHLSSKYWYINPEIGRYLPLSICTGLFKNIYTYMHTHISSKLGESGIIITRHLSTKFLTGRTHLLKNDKNVTCCKNGTLCRRHFYYVEHLVEIYLVQ